MNHVDIDAKAQQVGDEMRAYIDRMGGMSFRPGSAGDVVAYVRENKIESVRCWFTDLNGGHLTFAFTPEELEGAFDHGMGFDGSSVDGYQRINESDMLVFPLAETARLLPFRIGPASAITMFAEVRSPKTGEQYERDPRHILKKNLDTMRGLGFSTMNIGPEAEYFYFRREGRKGGARTPIDQARYFSSIPIDAGDAIRELNIMAFRSMGIPVEYHHHECAPGQNEIDIKYTEALEMADRIMTFKWVVKRIGKMFDLDATFMPKPIPGENGSGMHTHISLFNEGKNAFYDPAGTHSLSPVAQSFIEGVLQHACEAAFITNPQFNSYKRLLPGFEAPVYIAWSASNRSALVRIPDNRRGNEEATRAEIRFPDPSCNPYLAFSVLLRAGLDGVSRGLGLRPEEKLDLYQLSAMEREERGIPALPHDLHSAMKIAERSDFLKEVIGASALEKLLELKLEENHRYWTQLSAFEIAEGMNL